MNPNIKEFKALQAKWYKKAKKSGFDDIEQEDGNLVFWSSHFRLRYNESTTTAKEEYYRLAGHFLFDHEFISPLEKEVWRLHADGMSIRDIVQTINAKSKRVRAERTAVHLTLTALTKIMLKGFKNE